MSVRSRSSSDRASLPTAVLRKIADGDGAATRATDAVGPAHLFKREPGILKIGEEYHGLHQASRLSIFLASHAVIVGQLA